MSDMASEATEELLAGRRALDGVPCAEIIADWAWYADVGRWVLHLRISADVASDGDIPQQTEWFVHCGGEYPWGDVRFYPAKSGGLTSTYHHQIHNAAGGDGVPWRDGWLCLKRPAADALRVPTDALSEPTDADSRLAWYCRRAARWLVAASRLALISPGDPFELPHFRVVQHETVAFVETAGSFARWRGRKKQAGICLISRLAANEHVVCVREFRTLDGETCHEAGWPAERFGAMDTGVWVRLPSVPIVSNWEAPTMWRDLLALGDTAELLGQVAACIRDDQRHILLVGFPIPSRVGAPEERMHWQAATLPELTTGPAPGFSRPTERSRWLRDKTVVLPKSGMIRWHQSENWAPDQLGARGRLSDMVCCRNVLLIGCGALGAPVAEMLVRGGLGSIVLMDGDALVAGNLVRHTLGVSDVGTNKARALAGRLEDISVDAEVEAYAESFPPNADGAQARIADCDVVIDCTGDYDLLRALEAYPWGRARDFITLSVGYGARALYCFGANGTAFPRETFCEQFTPWGRSERQEHPVEDLPWEGIGCWHPVFPARTDDVLLMAAASVKFLQGLLEGRYHREKLVVFRQALLEEAFLGLHMQAGTENDGLG